MQLIEIFDQLSHGELVQLDLGNGDQSINPRDYPRIGHSVNQALSALHTRFFLKHGEIRIALAENLTRYVLDSIYAESNTASQEPTKYLLDSANPFQDDVLKIKAVYAEEEEEEPLRHLDPPPLPLNVIREPRSVRTLDYRTLVFPPPDKPGLIRRVDYAKGHRRLVARDWENPERSQIDLPYTHMQALLFYVASRLMNPLGGNEQGNHEGKYYMGLYEKEVRELTGEGLEIEQDFSTEKFRMRGFV